MSDIPPGFRPVLSDNYRQAILNRLSAIEDSARRLRQAAARLDVDAAKALAHSMDPSLDSVDLGLTALAIRDATLMEVDYLEADARTLRGLLQLV